MSACFYVYLILDGTGGGSHTYEDANAILTMAQDDRFLLLSADDLYYTAPRDHNMVTVTRLAQKLVELPVEYMAC